MTVEDSTFTDQHMKDLAALMVVVWLGDPVLAPMDRAILNGHPLVVTRELSRNEYLNRVRESQLSDDWLTPPTAARFYEVTTD